MKMHYVRGAVWDTPTGERLGKFKTATPPQVVHTFLLIMFDKTQEEVHRDVMAYCSKFVNGSPDDFVVHEVCVVSPSNGVSELTDFVRPFFPNYEPIFFPVISQKT